MTSVSKEVVSSLFSGSGLQRSVLSRYRLPDGATCRFLTGGLNDTYVIESPSTKLYLRLYRCDWRRKQDIAAEVDMLVHLAQDGQPVSRPVARRDGSYLTRIRAPEGTRWAVVFTDAPGAPPRLNAARAAAYGEVVAGLHVSADRVQQDPRRFCLDLRHLIEEPIASIEPFLKHRADDLRYLTSIGSDLSEAIESMLPKSRPEFGFCHGDHHGGNVHQGPDGGLVVFDFDCYGYGWRAYDLAVMLWQLAHSHGWSRSGRAKVVRRWNGFLEGYNRVRSLGHEELAAIRLFVPVRQIWWLGLHTHMRLQEVWGGTLGDAFFDANLGYLREACDECGIGN